MSTSWLMAVVGTGEGIFYFAVFLDHPLKSIIMRGSIKFDTFRGITLHLHWTLFIPIGWIALVNARMGNDILQLSWSLLFILAVLTSIILHELAHALVAARFGINAKDIVILPIGGIASIEKFPGNPAQELAIGVAGPLINLLIAVVIYGLMPAGATFFGSPFRYGATVGSTSLADLGTVNLLLALFNLIPAFPLDGGRMLLITQRSVRERFALQLIVLREKYKENFSEGMQVEINMTREDLANLVGTTRENIVRILGDFKGRGIVETKGRKIVVKDVLTLIRIANYK
ncbi:site-2 protease family protein [Paraflavitalea sp. CAU 1676]|uniref:site-2 protease family protein n=1 Tax=Paraflavitalea sp. CAU 1676 TaxID=3032598 RepID=UPI0023DB766A|nr:site-2 protease family protein [Paraflavitalea sp. CAU 1676]MDF2191297.1 site-2 protease family protein [Paraflavitalea sp. CAU 1676]